MRDHPFEPVPRAIFFDLDDTLCDYAGARQERLRIAFSLASDLLPKAVPDLPVEQMVTESIAMHPHGVDHFEALFAQHGIRDGRIARAAADWYTSHRFYGLRLFPAAAEIVHSLRSITLPGDGDLVRPVGIITNGPADVQQAKVDLLGLRVLVDFVIVSGAFGVAKPHPAIFAEALRQASVQPSDAVFVGDSPEYDMAGARAAGMRSIWMNAQGRDWEARAPAPDREVRSLRELLPIVGSTFVAQTGSGGSESDRADWTDRATSDLA